ncbi:hypothetical protein QBC38DRAFT_222114 [Podospora fimiseda]|uniref:Uncharacterized protein n=1 Tax=Podospora fimiseda TaxID=252190 RepID=A0AAN7GTE7_9PEZI|nr:hypothetical protein QBC38DRAFT_222114 [Podospora fimiseda]
MNAHPQLIPPSLLQQIFIARHAMRCPGTQTGDRLISLLDAANRGFPESTWSGIPSGGLPVGVGWDDPHHALIFLGSSGVPIGAFSDEITPRSTTVFGEKIKNDACFKPSRKKYSSFFFLELREGCNLLAILIDDWRNGADGFRCHHGDLEAYPVEVNEPMEPTAKCGGTMMFWVGSSARSCPTWKLQLPGMSQQGTDDNNIPGRHSHFPS